MVAIVCQKSIIKAFLYWWLPYGDTLPPIKPDWWPSVKYLVLLLCNWECIYSKYVYSFREGFTEKSSCSFGFCPNYLDPLTQYIQFVKSGQNIWAGPSPPPHLDKIQKNSYFFFVKPSLRVPNLLTCLGMIYHVQMFHDVWMTRTPTENDGVLYFFLGWRGLWPSSLWNSGIFYELY